MSKKAVRDGISTYSKSIGKSQAYLSVIKSQRSKKYRYIYALGKGDIILGYEKYNNYGDRLRNIMIDIVEFKGKESVIEWLFEHKFYRSLDTAYKFAHSVIYNYNDVNIKLLVKMRNIIKQYLKENDGLPDLF